MGKMNKTEIIEKLNTIDCEIAQVICDIFMDGKLYTNQSILVFVAAQPSNDDLIKTCNHWRICEDIDDFSKEVAYGTKEKEEKYLRWYVKNFKQVKPFVTDFDTIMPLKTRNIMKSIEKLRECAIKIEAEIKDILSKQPNNVLLTDTDEGKPIYCFVYGSFGEVNEYHVKGIRLCFETIQVLFDHRKIVYEIGDLTDKTNEGDWLSLDTYNFLYYQTLVNIADCLEEYIKD